MGVVCIAHHTAPTPRHRTRTEPEPGRISTAPTRQAGPWPARRTTRDGAAHRPDAAVARVSWTESRYAAQARGSRRVSGSRPKGDCGSRPKGDYGGKGSWLRPDPRVPACRVSRQHQQAEPLLPTSPAGDLLTGFSVHKPVDDLCRKAPDLSAHAEMLGIPSAGPAHNRALTARTLSTPCARKETEIVHRPRRNSS